MIRLAFSRGGHSRSRRIDSVELAPQRRSLERARRRPSESLGSGKSLDRGAKAAFFGLFLFRFAALTSYSAA
jgi:hypothetical protein